jgi:hypothetical protein
MQTGPSLLGLHAKVLYRVVLAHAVKTLLPSSIELPSTQGREMPITQLSSRGHACALTLRHQLGQSCDLLGGIVGITEAAAGVFVPFPFIKDAAWRFSTRAYTYLTCPLLHLHDILRYVDASSTPRVSVVGFILLFGNLGL